MKFKPWYVLIWSIIAVVGFLGSNPTYWSDITWAGLGLNIGVPIVIYFVLRQREKSKIPKMI